MRIVLPCTVLIGLLLSASVHAQVPAGIAAGDSIRFRATWEDPWSAALVHEIRGDTLFVAVDGRWTAVSMSRLVELEVLRSTEFDGRGAWRGMQVGLLLGLVTGVATREPVAGLVVAGLGAPLGAALGGGGPRAVRGGVKGLLIGGAIGGLAGFALGDRDGCGGDVWFCLEPGGAALVGGVIGGVAGGYIGTVLGALSPDRTWERVALTGLGVAPSRRGGVALAVSLAW